VFSPFRVFSIARLVPDGSCSLAWNDQQRDDCERLLRSKPFAIVLLEILADNEFPLTFLQLPADGSGLQIAVIPLTCKHLDLLRGPKFSDFDLMLQASVEFRVGCEPRTHGVLAESE